MKRLFFCLVVLVFQGLFLSASQPPKVAENLQGKILSVSAPGSAWPFYMEWRDDNNRERRLFLRTRHPQGLYDLRPLNLQGRAWDIRFSGHAPTSVAFREPGLRDEFLLLTRPEPLHPQKVNQLETRTLFGYPLPPLLFLLFLTAFFLMRRFYKSTAKAFRHAFILSLIFLCAIQLVVLYREGKPENNLQILLAEQLRESAKEVALSLRGKNWAIDPQMQGWHQAFLMYELAGQKGYTSAREADFLIGMRGGRYHLTGGAP